MTKTAEFRFYEELNDFLPEEKRKKNFPFFFMVSPSVKDAIESLGVPHTEVDMILVNSRSVDFSYRLQDKDRISVYPVFESLDISGVTLLQERPLRSTLFILDVHLGRLAKLLRMTGFDSLYDRHYEDDKIINIALSEKRAILTRNTGILKQKRVTRGYWVRSVYPEEQLLEVIKRFDLASQINPFSRCMDCNGIIARTLKENVMDELEPLTKEYYDDFFRCVSCGKIYWKGSHYDKMINFINDFRNGL